VNSGGTFLLGASNQVNDSAAIALAGGTLAKGDFSEGSVTLTGIDSHLDFGIGNVGTLSFASFDPAGSTLLIDNWTGTTETVGTDLADRLIFRADQSANLSLFSFTGYADGARQFDLGNGYYEVIPTAVPEPSTYAAAALALLVVGYQLLMRRRRAAAAALVSVPTRL
jgi:hypothetical protein